MQIIDQTYRRTEEISSLARELDQDLGDSAIDFSRLEADAGIDEAPVVRLLQTIFEDAVQIRASDIHIEPQEHKLQIRFRIDGVMHMQAEADLKIASALARLKVDSGDDAGARDILEAGLVYSGQDAEYHAFYASLLQRDSQHDKAIGHYLIALQTSPSMPAWLVGIGISLQAVNKLNDASSAFKRAQDTGQLNPQLSQFVEQRLNQLKSVN